MLDARAIHWAEINIERMPPVPAAVEELPRKLERGFRVVITAGNVYPAVPPILPDIAAINDEVPADFAPLAALVISSKIETLAFARRDDDVAQKLHICVAALVTEVTDIGLLALVRVRGGNTSDNGWPGAAGAENRSGGVGRRLRQRCPERNAVRDRSLDAVEHRIRMPGIGLVQFQCVLWNPIGRLRSGRLNWICLDDERLPRSVDLI